jgi:hypothetical protein
MHAATKSTHAAAAASIRAEFKRNKITARVTSESFSMGNAVRVRVIGDHTPAARKAIEAFCNQFQYGHFDGMTDSYEHTNRRDDLPQVKYVSVSFEISETLRSEAQAYVAQISGIDEHERDRYVHMVLNGTWGSAEFWRARKPRRRFEHAAQQVAA